ncbi:MAG: RNA polymerase subunit sigma-70 [Acidobacteriota bacterium]|nr:RNA polymerase subunit sigma-70 [Acidobacteriota bacterium]
MIETHEAVEKAARDSWGRLLAFLSARCRDVAAAEDALAEAFRNALETWPRTGVPDKPEAWLMVAARRKLVDVARHRRVHEEATPALIAITDVAQHMADSAEIFPDERLKLLFVFAHPAIDPSSRTPLMLQVVLGLDAARIASAFLVKPSAMGQRLTRAKTKIRVAGLRFELPSARDLPGRMDAVLEAIYAAYGSGWDDVAGADHRRKGLAKEAIDLCTLLLQLMPGEPEVHGLLALMLYCEARREARRSDSGAYIPLSEQDVTCWSGAMIEQAERLLESAAQFGRMGNFQLEAAIQSVHAHRARSGRTDWVSIAPMYDALVRIAQTIGALVGRAAAVAESSGEETALALLEEIPPQSVATYQPYWALSAHLLKRMQRFAEAKTAYTRAIGLCEDSAMREFLRQQAS